MDSLKLLSGLTQRLASTSPIRWLMYAAALHLLTTLIIFLIGHFQLLPSSLDVHGIGTSFAPDGTVYRVVSAELAETLRHQGISAWFNLQAPFHCRLLSIAFVFPGAIVGYNILAAEPLHLAYYLAILFLVYSLAKTLFNSCAGLFAAGVIAIWPTFLIHSTQPIRDSISIALMLSLFWIMVVVLQRTLSWTKASLACIVGTVLLVLFWMTRGNFWNVVLAACAVTLVLLVMRAGAGRRMLLTNFLVMLVLLAAALLIPTRIQSTALSTDRPPIAVIAIPSGKPTSSRSMWSRMVTQIRARRGAFKVYTAQQSNLDTEVQFDNEWDILKYVPRAAVIGFFAPFPRMWFDSGTSGRAARLLSGVETLTMYLLYIPAIMCIWSERQNLAVWLMTLMTVIGVTALGLVVLNAGALYRFRYVFWMMVIILAAKVISDGSPKVRLANPQPSSQAKQTY